MSAKQLDKIPKSTMLAAWAIALGAIAPMLDSTMINIAIDDLTQYFDVSLNMGSYGLYFSYGNCSPIFRLAYGSI